MSNPQWPTIAAPNFPTDQTPDDPTLRASVAGYEITRPEYTRFRSAFTLKWRAMTSADLSTLMTFYTTTVVAGSLVFDWTSPIDNGTKTVRFSGPPKISQITDKLNEVSVELREA